MKMVLSNILKMDKVKDTASIEKIIFLIQHAELLEKLKEEEF